MNTQNGKIRSLEKANAILGLNDIPGNKIIIVYSPPRVGSTSLVSSLRLSGSHIYKVLHIHDEQMLKVVGQIKDVSVNDIIAYNSDLGREMFIFDIYREPLERKMSEFFGKLASFHFNADISVIEGYCVERLSKRFNSLFPYIGEEDHFLEIYDGVKKNPPVSFDHNNKLLHIKDKNINYIKLRLRDYNKWDEILGPILDIDIVKIIDNTRDMLPLNRLYKKFKKEYLIPENFINRIKKSKSFLYYLTEDEQTSYLDKLSLNKTEVIVPFSQSEFDAYNFISSENQKDVDVEADHYFDEGCQCKYCCQVRYITIDRLKQGMPPIHKILHRLCYNKYTLNNNIKPPLSRQEKEKQKKIQEEFAKKLKEEQERQKLIQEERIKKMKEEQEKQKQIHEEKIKKIKEEQEKQQKIQEETEKQKRLQKEEERQQKIKEEKEIRKKVREEQLQLFKEEQERRQKIREEQLQIFEEEKERRKKIQEEAERLKLIREERLKIFKEEQEKHKLLKEEKLRLQKIEEEEERRKKIQEIQEKRIQLRKEQFEKLKERYQQYKKIKEEQETQKLIQEERIKIIKEAQENHKFRNNYVEKIDIDTISDNDDENIEIIVEETKYDNTPPIRRETLQAARKNQIPPNPQSPFTHHIPFNTNKINRNKKPLNYTNHVRRVYKREDGTFITFVKDETNKIVMKEIDDPFVNNHS